MSEILKGIKKYYQKKENSKYEEIIQNSRKDKTTNGTDVGETELRLLIRTSSSTH